MKAGMSRTPSALTRLAARFGIEPSFRDVSGSEVFAGPTTQRRLLAAMGVRADTENELDAAVAAADSCESLSPLPPAIVIRTSEERGVVDLALPAGKHSIAWRLVLEDGTVRSGSGEPGHTPGEL